MIFYTPDIAIRLIDVIFILYMFVYGLHHKQDN